METLVGLLRGVNVGGKAQIRMATLKEICESLGFTDVATYVQSGNVVFRTRTPRTAAHKLEQGIVSALGFRPVVVTRTVVEMHRVVAANPFAGRPDIVPARLLVFFLSEPLVTGARASLATLSTPLEQLHPGDREVYVYYSQGLARPKLSPALIEKRLNVAATSRNWNTVTRLLAMAEDYQARR